MRILVIGAGAREHALLRALSRDPLVTELHVSPGNAGMADIATLHDASVAPAELHPDLVVIGPEAPLVAGLADELRAAGIPVFGPSKAAAALEGSKAFAKEVMAAAGVATAQSVQVTPTDGDVEAALDQFGPMFVVKDDGLAGGKGVVVTDSREKARAHAQAILQAGNPVLFESFLPGPEVSLFCLVDGETVVPLLPAQDHKRAYDGDEGPNTGGMGAYAPLPWLPEGAVERIVDEVCRPVAREMVRRGTPYSGLLYAGLAWGPEGPAVVEFNARFGDPETQAVLALLRTPLAGLLHAVATGTLAQQPPLEWEDGYAVTVVLAAQGYPDSPRKGDPITAIPQDTPQAYTLHAGTAPGPVSAGGRVLSVVATGESLSQARQRAYDVIGQIELEGSFYRSDIALPAVEGRIQI
ncbi:phosphoribosylamine--glycine ligase [Corynebacterium uberis]|uniref:phosphoribosylamine--glycine ligase n=1 Tax=Corynebacterium TaxID=1716 RepID=UPI001D09DE92|nr:MULTISPECIES: phosphoribosylamine--glycine ligase [Corynebacterium]MCZ9310301.1 phosphoribosylamine--glycine ligase [Corynebacterium sp. c6VSa_13]UDL73630.1 phosphoribosylamine--glycine ligase [Corynebacterium uberis]UDL75490.1 phosphoribosylamine--glycine ligase [Corynebacterium uberis]UDL77703.1 phosphoribosylamine--glycine ligase [Corynebacterium uberis]UDL79987.1 phosphoribosylamine--glycine ligase [Corynebacterium uberis]